MSLMGRREGDCLRQSELFGQCASFVYCIAVPYCHIYQAVRQMHLTFKQDNLSLLKNVLNKNIHIFLLPDLDASYMMWYCSNFAFLFHTRRAAGPRKAVGQQQLDGMPVSQMEAGLLHGQKSREKEERQSLHYFQLLVLKPAFLLNWTIGYFMNLLLTSTLNLSISWWEKFWVIAAQWQSYLKTCFCLYSCRLTAGLAVWESGEFSCLLCIFDLFLGSGVMYVTAYCNQLELVIETWLRSDNQVWSCSSCQPLGGRHTIYNFFFFF